VDRIWVTRHGHTPYTDTSTFNADLRRQVGLDAVGREQARRIGAALQPEPIDVCLVSEFARARETAILALRDRGVPIEVRPELNEVRCGDYFEGRTYGEYFQWCVANGLFTMPPGDGGVCLADTLLRLHAAFSAITRRPERMALVVTHGFAVSFARRMVDLAVGEMLFPFPRAEPAELHCLDVPDVVRGLDQIPDRVRVAAGQSPAGREWAARAFPQGERAGQ
jgi:broad specificity phosphatase PhoE